MDVRMAEASNKPLLSQGTGDNGDRVSPSQRLVTNRRRPSSQNNVLPAPSSCDWMTWNDCSPPARSDHLDNAITSSDSALSALMSADSGHN
ncbi:hypothetical protein ACOMHN_011237 [Nucella lapillus]